MPPPFSIVDMTLPYARLNPDMVVSRHVVLVRVVGHERVEFEAIERGHAAKPTVERVLAVDAAGGGLCWIEALQLGRGWEGNCVVGPAGARLRDDEGTDLPVPAGEWRICPQKTYCGHEHDPMLAHLARHVW